MKASWQYVEIGRVCKTGAGGTPLKSKKEFYENGKVPWLVSGEVGNRDIWQSQNFITEKGLKKSSAKLFPKNSVLVAMYGATAGQVGILRFAAATNQAVCAIYPSDDTVPEFLYYALLNQKSELISKAVGNAQPNISQIKIKNTLIPLPPVHEQKQIVAILDEAFEKIARAKELAAKNLQNARELFESTLETLFFQKVRSYPKYILSDLCDFFNGRAHEKCIDDAGRFIVVNSKFVSTEGAITKHTSNQLFPLKIDDVVMVMSDVPKGKTLAKCFLIDQDNKYSLNQRICAIRSLRLNANFLIYQLNRNPYFLEFDNGENQTNLRKGDILKCPIYLPPNEMQEKLIQQVDELSKNIKLLQECYKNKLKIFDELKQSLLQKAFAGELT